MTFPKPERRQFPRLPIPLALVYRAQGAPSPVHSLLRDTSIGGVRIFTDRQLPVGMTVEIEIPCPGAERPVWCKTEVVWSGRLIQDPTRPAPFPFEAGVRFVRISAEDLQRLIDAATSGMQG